MKSETAAKAVKAMNPDVNIVARQDRVGPETECILFELFSILKAVLPMSRISHVRLITHADCFTCFITSLELVRYRHYFTWFCLMTELFIFK